jgi:hypothetical protein
MDCACIYIDPDSTPDFVNPVVVVARRSHKCYECGREIVPGENYECTAGKWAGEFLRFKTCADCLSVREAFFCEGFFYGDIWENVEEHIAHVDGMVSEDCLLDLTKAGRDKVIALIDERWDWIHTMERIK